MNKLEIKGDNYFSKYDFVRPASRAVIIKDGKILLSYETKHNIWMLPGGGKEIDETYRNCVIREVEEETGYLFVPSKCVLEIDEYYENVRYTSKYFVGTITGKKEIHLTEEEIKGGLIAKWVPVQEALDIFSKHSEIKDFEEKRGLYLRECVALQKILWR